MDKSPYIDDAELFERMNLTERLQHFLLIGSFLLLMITGLPLFFYEFKPFRWLLSSEILFSARGVVHRVAAVALFLTVVWHAWTTALTRRGRGNLREMLPRLKDVRDAVLQFGYNLGFTRFLYRRGILRRFFEAHPFWLFEKPPLYGRYNFIEKFEYWAVVWGSVVMIISGFFMWQLRLSLKLFPLWVHDIFVVIHGYEAILAFLSIIIWHMYNVHLNPEVFPMSRVWLDGQITGHELRTLHGLEYLKIHEQRAARDRVENPYDNVKG